MMVSTLFRASQYCLALVFVLLLTNHVVSQTPNVQQLTASVSRLDCGTVNIGETAPVTSYQLTARNLTDTITVLAPACVEVRTQNSPWQRSVRIAPLPRSTDSIAVFVRLASNAPMLVQSGIRHFVGLAEANIRLDVLGIVREKPVQSSAGTLEYAGHGLPTNVTEIYQIDSLLIAEQSAGYYSAPYYFSVNKGETWVKGTMDYIRMTPLFKAPHSVAAPDQTSLYAFTVISDSTRLQRSDDNGLTWRVLDYNIPFRSRIKLWAQGTIWIVRERENELYRSTDNGATWKLVLDTALVGKFFSGPFLSWGGSVLITAYDSRLENPFLLRSDDTGRTWKPLIRLPEISSYHETEMLSNGSACLALRGHTLYRLRDDGTTWELTQRPGRPYSIFVSNGQFHTWNRETGGLYRSTSGTFWQQIGTIKFSEDDSVINLTSAGTAVFAITFAELLRSVNGGATFHLGLSGIRSRATSDRLMKNDNVLWTEYNPLFRLLPTSSFWEYSANNFRPPLRRGEVTVGSFILSTPGIIYPSAGIFRRTSFSDGQVITQGFAPNIIINLLYHANGIVYAGSKNGIYRSLDSGLTWRIASTGLLSNAEITDFANIGTMMFAADRNNGLYRSSNNGETWELVGTPTKTIPAYGLQRDFEGVRSLTSSLTRLFVSTESGIYQSRDYGTTWSSLYTNPDFKSYIFLAAYRSPYLFISNSSGLYRLAVAPEPEFLLQPQTVRFRIASNNPSKPSQTIRLINTSSVAGEIRAITISQPEDFELLSSPPARIEAGDTASLTVRFRSKRPGTTRATITFTVTEPGSSVEIPLVCSITSEVSADAPFDSTLTGTSSPLTVGAVLPFPAADEATLYYTLESPTDMTLDLIDMRGTIVERLVNSVQTIGTHRVSISTRLLANGLYALVFRSRFGVEQRWLMVARQ
jgi:photosystem II stability/assembly factor-like uncharacterized protein